MPQYKSTTIISELQIFFLKIHYLEAKNNPKLYQSRTNSKQKAKIKLFFYCGEVANPPPFFCSKVADGKNAQIDPLKTLKTICLEAYLC